MSREQGTDNGKWHAKAECLGLDPDLFMDNLEGRLRKDWREADEACSRCKVREHCLQEALAIKDVWSYCGGKTPLERLPLLLYGLEGPPFGDFPDSEDAERQRQLDRRLLERMRRGAIPMPGRTCGSCGAIYDARSGVQRMCSVCRGEG